MKSSIFKVKKIILLFFICFCYKDGVCSQCHAGYKLDSGYSCLRISERIINEYFSYFSSDGELQSRSINFIAFSRGVYPKINDCEVYF